MTRDQENRLYAKEKAERLVRKTETAHAVIRRHERKFYEAVPYAEAIAPGTLTFWIIQPDPPQFTEYPRGKDLSTRKAEPEPKKDTAPAQAEQLDQEEAEATTATWFIYSDKNGLIGKHQGTRAEAEAEARRLHPRRQWRILPGINDNATVDEDEARRIEDEEAEAERAAREQEIKAREAEDRAQAKCTCEKTTVTYHGGDVREKLILDPDCPRHCRRPTAAQGEPEETAEPWIHTGSPTCPGSGVEIHGEAGPQPKANDIAHAHAVLKFDPVRWLTTCPAGDVNFKGALNIASIEQLREALGKIAGKPGKKTAEKAISAALKKRGFQADAREASPKPQPMQEWTVINNNGMPVELIEATTVEEAERYAALMHPEICSAFDGREITPRVVKRQSYHAKLIKPSE